jgi:hypothetical protein
MSTSAAPRPSSTHLPVPRTFSTGTRLLDRDLSSRWRWRGWWSAAPACRLIGYAGGGVRNIILEPPCHQPGGAARAARARPWRADLEPRLPAIAMAAAVIAYNDIYNAAITRTTCWRRASTSGGPQASSRCRRFFAVGADLLHDAARLTTALCFSVAHAAACPRAVGSDPPRRVAEAGAVSACRDLRARRTSRSCGLEGQVAFSASPSHDARL